MSPLKICITGILSFLLLPVVIFLFVIHQQIAISFDVFSGIAVAINVAAILLIVIFIKFINQSKDIVPDKKRSLMFQVLLLNIIMFPVFWYRYIRNTK